MSLTKLKEYTLIILLKKAEEEYKEIKFLN